MLSEFNVEAEINHPSQPANFRTLIGVWVDGVVLQQNKAELIGHYAIARSGLKDKYKFLVKKTRSYGFALLKNADENPISIGQYVNRRIIRANSHFKEMCQSHLL